MGPASATDSSLPNHGVLPTPALTKAFRSQTPKSRRSEDCVHLLASHGGKHPHRNLDPSLHLLFLPRPLRHPFHRHLQPEERVLARHHVRLPSHVVHRLRRDADHPVRRDHRLRRRRPMGPVPLHHRLPGEKGSERSGSGGLGFGARFCDPLGAGGAAGVCGDCRVGQGRDGVRKGQGQENGWGKGGFDDIAKLGVEIT